MDGVTLMETSKYDRTRNKSSSKKELYDYVGQSVFPKI